MSWLNGNQEVRLNMRELKKQMQETLDSLEDELDSIEGQVSEKEIEIETSQAELISLRLERQTKNNEISRVEQSVRLIAGRRKQYQQH